MGMIDNQDTKLLEEYGFVNIYGYKNGILAIATDNYEDYRGFLFLDAHDYLLPEKKLLCKRMFLGYKITLDYIKDLRKSSEVYATNLFFAFSERIDHMYAFYITDKNGNNILHINELKSIYKVFENYAIETLLGY